MKTYMLRADIDRRNMSLWAAAEGHRDSDRALHCLLYHTFGEDHVPRAFFAQPDPDQPMEHAHLLAYTGMDENELRDLARSRQSPLSAGVMSPFTFRTKPLPEDWQPGTAVSFRVRIMPTFRAKSTRSESDVHKRADAAPTRQESYCNWLADLLEKKAGVEPARQTLRVTRYNPRKVTRSRDSQPITVPDVTAAGTCVITDPEAWADALRWGIGRHKAYGYGMLLIRPYEG